MSMLEDNNTVFYTCDCCGQITPYAHNMHTYYNNATQTSIHYCRDCNYICGMHVCGDCNELCYTHYTEQSRSLVEILEGNTGIKAKYTSSCHYALIGDDEEWVCEDCVDRLESEDWTHCDQCGVLHNDTNYTDGCGCLCPNCYASYMAELEERCSDPSDWDHYLINSYHDSILEFDDPKNKLVFGTEFEFVVGDHNEYLDCYESVDNFLKDLTDSPINSAIERDASVDFEIISAPEGLDEVQKNLGHIVDVLNNYGCKSWDHTSGCGLHFHVNRRGVHHIKNIVKFFIDNETEIIKLSGRTLQQITSWCKFDYLPDLLEYSERELLEGTDFISRYSAINFNNSNTIEFRLFRASLKKERVNAYIAFLKAVFKNARILNRVTFNQLVATSKSKDLSEITGIPLVNKSLKQVMRG